MPRFARVSHLSMSVSDCERTARWWREVFELPEVARLEEDTWRAILLGLPGGMAIEFQQHAANEGETFDPARTGLDHLGLKVDSRDELLVWQSHFEKLGVDHTPTVDRVYGGQQAAVLTFRDPDRIQCEMFWMADHPE